MARTINIPSQLYPVGVYTQTLDNFNPNTDKAVATFTRESWPGTNEDTVMRFSIQWSSGDAVSSDFPGGEVIGKDGNVLLVHPFTVTVPYVGAANGNGKSRKNVVSALCKMEVFQALTTAITLEAL